MTTNEKLLLKSTYFYDLPQELVAQTPVEPRDSSRLLAFDKRNKKLSHKVFHDIIDFLREGDVLVINNTKVLPARLYGYKDTGAKIEILLQKRIDMKEWSILAKPTKRLKVGTNLVFSEMLRGEITEIGEFGNCKIKFDFEGVFEHRLSEVGTMPLPPYIKEKLANQERYQTVYAKEEGSSAAPTAGLHFTPELLEKIKAKGVEIVEVLLHVGLGTFRPVSEENILNHKMHSEFFEMSEENAIVLNKAKTEKRRIIAVGTTSVRVLESSFADGKIKPQKRETNIFIYPSYKFNVVDGIITNFHLPESTLIMLVSAFVGYEETMKVYEEAVKERYRFFSFGDACFFYEGE